MDTLLPSYSTYFWHAQNSFVEHFPGWTDLWCDFLSYNLLVCYFSVYICFIHSQDFKTLQLSAFSEPPEFPCLMEQRLSVLHNPVLLTSYWYLTYSVSFSVPSQPKSIAPSKFPFLLAAGVYTLSHQVYFPLTWYFEKFLKIISCICMHV